LSQKFFDGVHKELVDLQSLGVDLPMLPMPPGNPDEAGRILEGVITGG